MVMGFNGVNFIFIGLQNFLVRGNFSETFGWNLKFNLKILLIKVSPKFSPLKLLKTNNT